MDSIIKSMEARINLGLNMIACSKDLPAICSDTFTLNDKCIVKFVSKKFSKETYKKSKANQQFTLENVKNNIRVITIFEYEWVDIERRNRLIDFIKCIGMNKQEIVYARKCEVKYITPPESKTFLDEYHLQGTAKSPICLGLFYNYELIGVMTFGKPRFNKVFEFELVRLAYRDDVKVIGGTAKMFKFFLKEHKPDSIVSYCDIAKFTGNSYLKLGFKLPENGVTPPNYMWVSEDSTEALPRYKCMKHKLLEQGYGTFDMTENDIMLNMGYYKAYDCGNLRLEWFNNKQEATDDEIDNMNF